MSRGRDMLKNRVGEEVIPPVADDRPRKKLSFRDPEVVAPSNTPSSSSRATSPHPVLLRPHSVAGVQGLGGLSAHGCVPGVPTPPPAPSSVASSFNRSIIASSPITTSPGIPRRSYQNYRFSSQSPTRSQSHSRQSSYEEQYKVISKHHHHGAENNNNNSPRHRQSQKHSNNTAKKTDSESQRNRLESNRPPDTVSNGRNASLSLEDLVLENQAMKVVRTIGQAFEVCHKMAVKEKSPSPEPHTDEIISREGSDDSSDKPKKDGLDSESGQEDLMTLTSDTFNDEGPVNVPSRPSKLEPLAPSITTDGLKKGETFSSLLSEPLSSGNFLPQAGTPLSVHHELQLLREQLEQQQQQTHAAVAQVHLLRDQLAAETAARLEAQARTHQLLVHNKELLEHIQQLVLQVRDLEVKINGGGGVSSNIQMPPNLPDVKSDLSPASATTRLSQPSSPRQSSPFAFPETPSPSWAFRFPPSFHSISPTSPSPQSLSPQSPFLIPPLPVDSVNVILPIPSQDNLQAIQQQQRLYQQRRELGTQQKLPMRGEEGSCSTASLSSGDGDLRKDSSGQSSRESVSAATISQRLPQVPEDSIPLSSHGIQTSLAYGQNPFNGPITRAASERYSRQDTLAQMQRMAWARHSTK